MPFGRTYHQIDADHSFVDHFSEGCYQTDLVELDGMA
jgi:hypothetical protein